MAMRYENLTKTPQQRFSLTNSKNNSMADEAQALIALSKRQRAGTLPHKNNIISSPVYQPPRFADQCINTSKQFQNRKQKKMVKQKGAHSTPVSPNMTGYNGKDNDGSPPPNGTVLQHASKSLKTGQQQQQQQQQRQQSQSQSQSKPTKAFSKRRKGKGRAGKRNRKVLSLFFVFVFLSVSTITILNNFNANLRLNIKYISI